MFGSAKPLASLSSGLLARKGQARPAMRRQGQAGHAAEDLGWNDMGEPTVPALTTMPVAAPAMPVPVPQVLVEREALQETIAATPAVDPVAAPAPLPKAAAVAQVGRDPARKARAAFTLRLDADRHLRLRLASATQGRSSQQLVTQALDAFLATLPEVEALARRMPGSTDLSGDGS